MRILLVEDDQMIGKSLVTGLTDDGYAVDWVKDGNLAIAALHDAQADYAIALLDWGLPERDGLSVLTDMRRKGIATPVLMITARDSLMDRVTGLDSGADDYLVKPFELAELKARMRSLLRRRSGRTAPTITHGDLSLNPVSREAQLRGRQVALSAREFSLLYALMENPGAVLSRSQLEEQLYAWHSEVQSNAVEFIIHNVRKKVGSDVIENVRGAGWRISATP